MPHSLSLSANIPKKKSARSPTNTAYRLRSSHSTIRYNPNRSSKKEKRKKRYNPNLEIMERKGKKGIKLIEGIKGIYKAFLPYK